MTRITDLSIDVLRFLRVNGLSTKSEIEKFAGKLLPSTLSNLKYCGHVAADSAQKELRYSITTKGINKLLNPSKSAKRPTRKAMRDSLRGGTYQEHETRGVMRLGSMRAYSLPSRIGDSLYWPDGRISGLDGHNLISKGERDE
jgi:hypothetical protein